MRDPKRRNCPAARKRELLDEQMGVCIYCEVPFGSVVRRRGRYTLSTVHFDHLVPIAYLDANPLGNWVAACNFCNMIKSARVFNSLDDARVFLKFEWERQRIEVCWQPQVSSEIDPERWAVKFASYLASLPKDMAGAIAYTRPWTRKPSAVAAGAGGIV